MFARKYLAYQQQLQNNQCSVCFELDYFITRLTCPCQKLICVRCIKNIYNCKICSIPIEVTQGSKIQMLFTCPSKHAACNQKITSLHQFYVHCLYCSYTQQSIKIEANQIYNFQCVQSHGLKVSNSYTYCRMCGKHGHCKSMCRQCQNNQSYCIQCRPLPCTKTKCPHGHDFQSISRRSSICDMCGTSVKYYMGAPYTDILCDLDICSLCYQRLPKSKEELLNNIQQIKAEKQ